MQNFNHYHSAHCESGAIASLLKNRGYNISEAMIFGVSGVIFFIHFPFIKLYDIPLTSYRDMAGKIITRTSKHLHFEMNFFKYKNEQKSMDELDVLIEKHGSLGLQTSVYWLPYLPEELRFHFNAHHIIVYGKEKNEYLVSDPVLDLTVKISREDLMKARFAKGIFAPKGLLYYPLTLPEEKHLKSACIKGIKIACNRMLFTYMPFLGVSGIKYLAKSIKKWINKYGSEKKVRSFIGNVVRMQEEIGTGGAGFRFMYACFLQEAGILLNVDEFQKLSIEMTGIGDKWREFALIAGRICKSRAEISEIDNLSKLLFEISEIEKKFFLKLFQLSKKL